jgi:ABC-type transport system involved in multi-copper enzyme maturation permease subunit
MFRTAFSVAVVGLAVWVAMKVLFGVTGGIIGLLLSLAWLALKVVLVVGLIYWLLTVFSPDMAKKMKDSVRGENL